MLKFFAVVFSSSFSSSYKLLSVWVLGVTGAEREVPLYGTVAARMLLIQCRKQLVKRLQVELLEKSANHE